MLAGAANSLGLLRLREAAAAIEASLRADTTPPPDLLAQFGASCDGAFAAARAALSEHGQGVSD